MLDRLSVKLSETCTESEVQSAIRTLKDELWSVGRVGILAWGKSVSSDLVDVDFAREAILTALRGRAARPS
jgi:hypothetical protein